MIYEQKTNQRKKTKVSTDDEYSVQSKFHSVITFNILFIHLDQNTLQLQNAESTIDTHTLFYNVQQ